MQLKFLFFICILFIYSIGLAARMDAEIDSTKTEKLLSIGKSLISNYPDSAFKIVDNIYDTTLNINDKATSARLLGQIFKQKGLYENALTYFLEGYDLCIKSNNIKGQAFACNNIGIVYYNIKKYEDARIYLEKSIVLKNKIGLQKELASSYINIANIFMKQNQYDSSEIYYHIALKIGLKYKDENIIFSSFINLGEINLDKKEFKKALIYYNKALIIAQNESQTASCFHAIGKIQLHTDDLFSAKKNLDIAMNFALKLGNRPLESQIYQSYSMLYEKMYDYENSLIYFKKYQQLKDTLFNSENTKRMEEMKNQFEMELKDEQIALLNKDFAIQDAESKRTLILKNSFIIAFIFIFIISIILYKNVKIKQKSNLVLLEKNHQIEKHQSEIENINRELAEYNKELMKENISAKYEILKSKINPHFLFNSLSTLSSLIINDQRKAMEFVSKFSKLYRSILELGNHQFVKLNVELNFSENYLKLQKFRFSDNLIIHKNIDTKTLGHLIPPFSLQLVLENAMKHNMISQENKLEIWIYTKDNQLYVVNSLQKRLNKSASIGLGQKSIIERYKIFTDKEPIFEEKDGFYWAIIPLIKPEENL